MVEIPVPGVRSAPASTGEQALMDLSVTLAHRIRGLVASIEGYTDLLVNTLGTSEQRELALRVFEGAARIERVLADLQLYGQPVEPAPAWMTAQEAVSDVLRFLDEGDEGRVTVEEAGRRTSCIHADPALLRQALLSLLKNALEAKKAGAIRLNVIGGEAGTVRFDVWNEGAIGLDDAAIRVFVPFFTTKAQNLGIGLPVARRIAEAHGGTLILAESTAANGTCFSLCIPAHPAPIATVIDL